MSLILRGKESRMRNASMVRVGATARQPGSGAHARGSRMGLHAGGRWTRTWRGHRGAQSTAVLSLSGARCGDAVRTGMQIMRRGPPASRATNDRNEHSAEVGAGGNWTNGMFSGDALDEEVLSLALPALGALAIDPLLSVVDAAFVGKYGSSAELGGMGLAISIFSFCFRTFNFLCTVTGPLVASKIAGAASRDGDGLRDARSTVRSALLVAGMAGVISLSILLFESGSILSLAGVDASSALFQPARSYLRLRAASLPFALVNTVAIGSFRGLLDTKTPLKVAIVINLINLVLDPVLIYGIGQHAYSGAAGAALATTISEIAGSLIFLHMMRESGLLSTEPSTGERLFDFDGMKDLLAGGLSQITRTVLLQAVLLRAAATAAFLDSSPQIVGEMLSAYGASELSSTAIASSGYFSASHNIVLQVWWTSLFCLDALAVAAQGLVASALNDTSEKESGDAPSDTNARNVARARTICDRLFTYGFVSGVAVMIVLLPSTEVIARTFTSDDVVVSMASSAMMLVALLQPLNGLVFVGDGIFQGALDFSYLAASMAFASAAALAVLGSITGHTPLIPFSLPPFNLIWAAFAVLQVGRAVGIFWRYMNNAGMGPLRSSAYPAAYGDGGDSAPDDADES